MSSKGDSLELSPFLLTFILRDCILEKLYKGDVMSFTQLKTTQNEFLEKHLRGTGRKMSAAQAEATYGIMNMRARMTEMRQAGLNIRKCKNTEGRTAYMVSRRDIFGDQFKLWA